MSAVPFAEFQGALLDASIALPAGFDTDPQTAARFAVHRHTCRSALIGALRSAYPAIIVAVGEDFFDALAAAFILQSPPQSPVLQEYSPKFAEFLDCFAMLAEWPWLGDVARIDWSRRVAYHALDATPFTGADLQALPVETLLAATLQLHPSLRVLNSSFPAWSLWNRRQGTEASADLAWHAQSTQVWRIDHAVCQRQISIGEAMLRHALGDGCTLSDALCRAHTKDANFDATSAFGALVSDGLIVAVNPSTKQGTRSQCEPFLHD
jgi:hypothetical protein